MSDLKELDFNNLYTSNAEGDRDTSITMSVYMGNASIAVWRNKKQLKKININKEIPMFLAANLTKAIENKQPGSKYVIDYKERLNPEAKQFTVSASIIFGRDDRNCVYMAINSAAIGGAVKFPIKMSMAWDTADGMSESERSDIAAKYLVSVFTKDIPAAKKLTSFKRQNTGGNNSGGNNYNNYKKPQQSTSAAVDDSFSF